MNTHQFRKMSFILAKLRWLGIKSKIVPHLGKRRYFRCGCTENQKRHCSSEIYTTPSAVLCQVLRGKSGTCSICEYYHGIGIYTKLVKVFYPREAPLREDKKLKIKYLMREAIVSLLEAKNIKFEKE